MNLRLLCMVLFLLFIALSCSVAPVFHSPNRLYNLPATIFLHHGDSVQGILNLNNEVMIKKVKIKSGSSKNAARYHLLEITSYKTAEEHYELKHLMGSSILGKTDYFMKRLTPTGSDIHLYEHKERHSEHRSGKPVVYRPKYYVQFPNEHRNAVWALDSERLVPHFHQKMGAVVEVCADLKQKINNKIKGYHYTQFNTSEKDRAEVVMRIINEYNYCQKAKAFSFRNDE